MGLSTKEQETNINYGRDNDLATIYTTDLTTMTRLDKLAENDDAPLWKLIKIHRLSDGTVVGKTYQTHKRLISFRAGLASRTMSEDQKTAAAERMKEWHERKKQEK